MPFKAYTEKYAIVVNTLITKCYVGEPVQLIGMDIISQGDFSISNKDKKTTFSFRFPSYEEIDFVAEYNEIKQSNQQ